MVRRIQLPGHPIPLVPMLITLEDQSSRNIEGIGPVLHTRAAALDQKELTELGRAERVPVLRPKGAAAKI